MINYLLSLPKSIKRILCIMIDLMLIILSYSLSMQFTQNNNMSISYAFSDWKILLIGSVITLAIFIKLGLYRAVLRYITLSITKFVLIGSFFSTVSFKLLSYFFKIDFYLLNSIIYFFLLSIFILSVRIFLRTILTYQREEKKAVIIYGAGDAGRQLLTALNQSKDHIVVAFIDDNRRLKKSVLHGVTIYQPSDLDRLVNIYKVKKILLALPKISSIKKKDILLQLNKYPCEVLAIPAMADIVNGKYQFDSLTKISISDLLGRESIEPIPELLTANITDKVVMVTGGGGSIGSELCRQIINLKPKKLVIFESNEFSLYKIHKELLDKASSQNFNIDIVPLLGTVQKKSRLIRIMNNLKVETIYHSAAYKHVPLVEYNVVEGVRNNIFGTLYVAQAAIEAGVKTFVLISTDKAVRPTNIMGTTKRMAELILQALAEIQSTTTFCMVRFGNVLGSSGSVIPLFEKQISMGGPITLTHPDITRYFMTIPEAALLVIQAGAMGQGGDVFVLDMGESVKIMDLAKRMILLSGLTIKDENNLDGDIEITISGLRPGEKLYEELLIGDNVLETEHSGIMRAKEIMLTWDEMSAILQELEQACSKFDLHKIRELLLSSSTGFKPVNEICDLVWKENENG